MKALLTLTCLAILAFTAVAQAAPKIDCKSKADRRTNQPARTLALRGLELITSPSLGEMKIYNTVVSNQGHLVIVLGDIVQPGISCAGSCPRTKFQLNMIDNNDPDDDANGRLGMITSGFREGRGSQEDRIETIKFECKFSGMNALEANFRTRVDADTGISRSSDN